MKTVAAIGSSLLAISLLAIGCGTEPAEEPAPSQGCEDPTARCAVPDMGGQEPAEDMSTGGPAEEMGEELAPDAGADMRPPEPGEDMSPEAEMGSGEDMGPARCAWPTPQLGASAQAQALALAPQRCGQPAHTWIDPSGLGRVTELGQTRSYRKEFIEAALATQDVTLEGVLEYDTRVQQFAYMTQDRGAEIEATALLAYPKDAAEPRGTLLLLHGTTGFNDECAPSRSIVGLGLAALFSSAGYVVVAPDFIGLKGMGSPSEELHPYLVGQATAIASLDALRALPQLPAEARGGLCPPAEALVFGGSQGGHATLWVDRLAPYYAPEITLKGSVATVPPADTLSQMERALEQEVSATGNTIAFLGSAASWYGAEDELDTAFQPPYDAEVPAALAASCDPGDELDPQPALEQLFSPMLYEPARRGDLDMVDPWGCMAAENGLTTTSIERLQQDPDSYGVLMVYGEEDGLVHTPIEREAFGTLCEQGMPLAYLECAGAGHTPASFWAIPEILDFLAARQAGEVFDAPCQVAAPTRCRATPADE